MLSGAEIPQTLSRPTLHKEADNFTVLLHHSPPKSYPEEVHRTVQIGIPFHGARYEVSGQGTTGQGSHIDYTQVTFWLFLKDSLTRSTGFVQQTSCRCTYPGTF